MYRAWVLLGLLLCGCTAEEALPQPGQDALFILPGVGGNAGYEELLRAVVRPGRSVFLVPWGVPMPLFVMNYSDKAVHDEAEHKLAVEILAWRKAHPTGRIDMIGHSAGSGVLLGALAQLDAVHIHNVILLAPSVSPGYDLGPALAHIDGKLHVFYSDRDMLLEWRTSSFETYDRVHAAAAGYGGFQGKFPPEKVVQHAYDPHWDDLGYDGGHWGPLAERFERQVVVPLLYGD